MDDPTPPRAPSAGLFQIGAVIEALGRAGAVTVCFQSLAPNAARELALHLLEARAMGQGLVEQLDRTGSNPPFLVELLTALRIRTSWLKVEPRSTSKPPRCRPHCGSRSSRRLATLGEPVVSSLKRRCSGRSSRSRTSCPLVTSSHPSFSSISSRHDAPAWSKTTRAISAFVMTSYATRSTTTLQRALDVHCSGRPWSSGCEGRRAHRARCPAR